VIIDFVFLWPENHLLAFLALGAGASLLAIYELTVIGIKPLWIASIVAAIFVAVGVANFVAPSIPPPEPWRGWLQPANEPTPVNGCTNPPSPPPGTPPRPQIATDAPLVVIGGTGLSYSGREKEWKVITIGQCPSLVLIRSGEGLKANAPIYDATGNSLGDIKGNGYQITKEASLVVEHSDNLSTLVVHDKDGKELLYVHYANPHAIKVRGEFFCPTDHKVDGLVATENGITYEPQHITFSGLSCLSGASSTMCINCRHSN
jgi:hypothetical protein